MKKKNPYEHLKTPFLDDAKPVEAQSSWSVTEGRHETVTILTSLLDCGSWVYGYVVHWLNGRTSSKKPTAEMGLFRSQREAKLYAIGFMLLYSDFFTEETRANLHKAENSCLQDTLF